jgi:hypothetical protein
MQKKLPTLFAGIALLAAGSLALVDNLGWVNGLLPAGDRLPPVVWLAAFAFMSALALAAYLVSGVAQWGWLFPAGVFGGLAVMMGLVTQGFNGGAISVPLFVGLAVPFAAAYLLDRARHWWALIPGGAMAGLALLMLVVDQVRGEWVGAGVLFFIAGAFLVVYLSQRERQWAALVAYILAVVGCMPLMASAERAPLAGVVMLFAIALPFLGMYLVSPARWWAIIPAGVLISTGVVAALVTVWGLKLDPRVANGLMLLGFGDTFAIVALRHQKRWAGAAAIVLGLIAVGVFFFQGVAPVYGPLLIVAAGAFLLHRALRPTQHKNSDGQRSALH